MITFRQKGDFSKTNKYLEKIKDFTKWDYLHRYGKEGVEALSSATPKDTGLTSESWYYEIIEERHGIYKIIWCNENLTKDWFNVALYLQLGHGTADGTWVEGIDYINPALAPVFNKLADDIWTEYTSNE